MIKVYELCILFLFLIFFIYHNYFSKTIVNIYGCTDITALNYNDSATTNDGTCFYFNEELDCYSNCSANTDPCLCVKNKDKSSDCTLNDREAYKFPTTELFKERLSENIKFYELIYTSLNEYNYSKLMQISQITYMDYIHTSESEISRKTPRFLFFIAIEFIKMKEYNSAINYLTQFINLKNNYNNLKCTDNGYYRFFGCCDYDLAWINDNSNPLFKIAEILKDYCIYVQAPNKKINNELLINSIEFYQDFGSDNTEMNVSSFIKSIEQYDTTPNTADLIDNIIFSMYLSLNDELKQVYYPSISKKLNSYTYITLDSFDDNLINDNSAYYLSSQIDILIMLKLEHALSRISLSSDMSSKSEESKYKIYTHDQNFAFFIYKQLIEKYHGNTFTSNQEDTDHFNIQYIDQVLHGTVYSDYLKDCELSSFNKIGTYETDSSDIFFNKSNDTASNREEHKKHCLDKYNIIEEPHNASILNIDKYNIHALSSFSNKIHSLDKIDILQNPYIFINETDKIINYKFFINSINSFKDPKFPKLKNSILKSIDRILDSNIYNNIKSNEKHTVLFKSKGKIENYTMYKNHIYALNIFKYMCILNDPNAIVNIKNYLTKIHHSKSGSINYNQYDYELGYKMFSKSLTQWQLAYDY